MARPTKQGLEYFPLDTDLKGEVEMFLLEKEGVGLAILVTVWQLVYRDEGYFIPVNDDLFLLVKKRVNVDIAEVRDCIDLCLRRGIFDERLFLTHHILTSASIQARFFSATTKRKCVTYHPEFLLSDISSYKNLVPAPINGVSSVINSTYAPFLPSKTPQSKVKESKVKESKVYPPKPPAGVHGNGSKRKYPKKEEFLAEEIRVAGEIFAVMNTREGTNFLATHPNGAPTENVKFVSALLRLGYSPDDLRRVALHQHTHWTARDDGEAFKRNYYRPETLFNLTKFVGYHGKLPQKPSLVEVCDG